MINLFNSMASNGTVANCHVFTILIDAYAKCGMMDEAMLIFTEMQGQGVSPDACTYLSVIAALCRMGRLDHAIDKFNQMISLRRAAGDALSTSTKHLNSNHEKTNVGERSPLNKCPHAHEQMSHDRPDHNESAGKSRRPGAALPCRRAT
jgi:pentatricopeptide repeat protein